MFVTISNTGIECNRLFVTRFIKLVPGPCLVMFKMLCSFSLFLVGIPEY